MISRISQLESASHHSWRERLFPVSWGLLLPVRCYLKFFPVQLGKGILLRCVVRPLLPPLEAEFELCLPGGAKIALRYRETLGLSSLLYGTFELAELKFVRRYLRAGDDVMDIGANVGIFSVMMGVALGQSGRVFAFEPAPGNVVRLRKNLEYNGLDHAQLFDCALGEADGWLTLHLATDPAYPSLVEVQSGLADGTGVPVQVRRLDSVWEETGRPRIAFVKIDVEGSEPGVIRGAGRMIEECRPTMLIEANSKAELDAIRTLLDPYGYQMERPEGFTVHNYIFFHPEIIQGRLTFDPMRVIS
jgi:FkbM family methyltransferase